jgi:acetoin utilization protein AcuB
MRIGEIMSTDVLATTPDAKAEHVWHEMQLRRIRHYVVMAGGRVVGVVSDRDLGGRSAAAVRKGRSVSDFMSHGVVTAQPDTTLRQAANLMRGRTIGCLPVIDDGQLVGIVTITDILDQLGRGAARPEVKAQRRPRRATPTGHHHLGGTRRTRVVGPKVRSRTAAV